MELVISPAGRVFAVYGEDLDLSSLGRLSISRASHVEPTPDGRWTADMRPLLGPVLGPFGRRSEAIKAETDWLGRHWLVPGT